MLLIGLTGPSGAGKGTVGKLFASFGLPVLDADAIYHQLLIPPSVCLNELAERFGRDILRPDGTLDRPALGSMVFSDAKKLNDLNRITHRHVLCEVKKQLDMLRATGCPAAVFDAPQLFESGADKDCDLIVAVLADTEHRLRRIMRRDGISEEAAMKRIRAQKDDAFFRTHATFVLENNTAEEELLPQVRKILQQTGVIPS